MDYKYIENGSSTLIVMFQSVGGIKKETFEKINDNDISKEELKKIHSRYNWIKFSTENVEFDYLFIQDFFSNSYGWYLFDSGKYVYEEVNELLNEYAVKYEEVFFFGSSKGGSAALLFGMLNKYVTHVFSLIPQIEIAKYINSHSVLSRYNYLFFNGDTRFEESVNNFLYKISQEGEKNTKQFYIYTGTKDNQFNEILKLRNNIIEKNIYNLTLIINRSDQNHTDLVVENKDFLLNVLKYLSNRKYIESKTYPIDDGVFLY